MSKHTPGPWVVRCDYVVQAPAYEDGRLVPVAQPYGVNCDGTDLFANARLIAAAPELLEALNAAVEAIEHGGLDDVMCCNGWDCGCRASTNGDLLVHDLRAAIAKATGK